MSELTLSERIDRRRDEIRAEMARDSRQSLEERLKSIEGELRDFKLRRTVDYLSWDQGVLTIGFYNGESLSVHISIGPGGGGGE